VLRKYKEVTLLQWGHFMHMADALLSPPVGAVMWAATAGITAYSARKVQSQLDNIKIPLMGAIGAFVFAAQMINFAIPGTGSSGHIGGGLLLAILLGPHAAIITLSSILTVQALFFADGGLLALGSNIFNLGFIPCYICYPLIYKPIVTEKPEHKRVVAGSIFAAVVSLQLGSLGVVLQTYFSNITSLPLSSFLLMMQPIHLAIGLVEGITTAGIVTFMWKARPEFFEITVNDQSNNRAPIKYVVISLILVAFLAGGVLSLYSSGHPDGLEWSIENITGSSELTTTGKIQKISESIQNKISFLPDYGFKVNAPDASPVPSSSAFNTGTTVSGIIGGLLILSCSFIIGFLLKKSNKIS
jgi:cobalt/nickel transport system permease protein